MRPARIIHYRDASPPTGQYATAATLYRLFTGYYLFDFQVGHKEYQLTKILFHEPGPIATVRVGTVNSYDHGPTR